MKPPARKLQISYEHLHQSNVERLCPILQLEQGQFVLLTHQMISVPTSILTIEVTPLENFRYAILSAIDLLVSGI